MKLLIHTNSPMAGTGYGQQAGLFAPLLAKHHDVRISAFYGLEGAAIEWNGVGVIGGEGHTFGNEYISAHVDNFIGEDDGLVMPLMDVWVLEPEVWRQFNVAAWTPVDHDPAPPLVERFFRETAAVPLAMSRFGMERLAEWDPIYVPHGIQTDVFKPYEKKAVRKKIGLPEDAFICGVVATNKGTPSRKSLVEICQAFAVFQKQHTDAVIYLHTEAMGRAEGVNLPSLLTSLDIPIESIVLADQYRVRFDPIPSKMMAELYSSFDVLCNPSAGEGFGIPIVEAQSCGTPVIASNTTAMPELVKSGWLVDGDPVWTMQRSWQVKPRPEDIVLALEAAYDLTTEQREQLTAQAREHALQYDVGRVFGEHMLPAIAEAKERLFGRSELEVVAA